MVRLKNGVLRVRGEAVEHDPTRENRARLFANSSDVKITDSYFGHNVSGSRGGALEILKTAEAEARLWEQEREVNQNTADNNRGLAGDVERKAAAAQQAADSAKVNAEEAADRVSRLKRGEPVKGGLRRPVDIEQVLRDAGLSDRDRQQALDMAALSEVEFEHFLEQIHKAERRVTNAVLRRFARRRVAAQ